MVIIEVGEPINLINNNISLRKLLVGDDRMA
jgi:hypothetical protein